MTRRNQQSTTFNCFSPPVMIATFIIEIVLAIYTVWRYKLDVLGRLIVASLVALAVFQLCEYHVCGGMGWRAEAWSRGGFVAITLLPALGVHMMHVLAGKRQRLAVYAGYAAMVAFVIYFSLAPNVFRGFACTGNYVIFQIGRWPSLFYATYYYGALVTSMYLGIHWVKRLKKQVKNLKRIAAMKGLVAGYLVFLVPVAIANSLNPATIRGVPSIMCGFAVIFAFIMVFHILPRLGQQRHSP